MKNTTDQLRTLRDDLVKAAKMLEGAKNKITNEANIAAIDRAIALIDASVACRNARIAVERVNRAKREVLDEDDDESVRWFASNSGAHYDALVKQRMQYNEAVRSETQALATLQRLIEQESTGEFPLDGDGTKA